MAGDFVLAHVSDLHLGPLVRTPLALFNLKRALGMANWQRSRRRIHRPDMAERVFAEAMRLGADHIAISGDLCNLGLPDEHASALRWLQRWGAADRISVVPGNHDIYSRIGRDPGTERWRPYMTSCVQGRALGGTESGFPFVRVFSAGKTGIALIGVNSAIETPPLMAHGRIGKEQMAAVEACLMRTREAGLRRIVMLHHPPLMALGQKRKALLDAEELEAMLGRAGAELVIYGHNHLVDLRRVPCGGRSALIVGIGSGSAVAAHHDEPAARLAIYRFGAQDEAAGVEIYGLTAPGGEICRLPDEERIVEQR